ncbi:MAG: hypothetical protein ABR599_03285 [Gemmatimonadota bacterium]
MRTIALLALLVLAAGAPLRAQGEAGDAGAAEHKAPAGVAAGHGGLDLAADWKQIEAHWEMVQSMPGPEKAEHLQMHREMLGEFMDALSTHAAVPGAQTREARPPAVGDRMEKADREPVTDERDEQADAAAEAGAGDADGKPGERIDPERSAEAAAAGEARSMADVLEEAQRHWAVVESIEDPAELEAHLTMQMRLLEKITTPMKGPKSHEEMRHEEMEHEGAEQGAPQGRGGETSGTRASGA